MKDIIWWNYFYFVRNRIRFELDDWNQIKPRRFGEKKKKAPLKLKVVWKWPAGIALLHTHTERDLNIEINGHITKNKGA